jgi:hypothetical protein
MKIKLYAIENETLSSNNCYLSNVNFYDTLSNSLGITTSLHGL